MVQFDRAHHTYGSYLKELRNKYKIPITEFTQNQGLDPSYISRIERDQRFPTLVMANEIAAVLKQYCRPNEVWRLMAIAGYLPDDWTIAHDIVSLVYHSSASKAERTKFLEDVAKLGLELISDLVTRDSIATKSLGTIQLPQERGDREGVGAIVRGTRGVRRT